MCWYLWDLFGGPNRPLGSVDIGWWPIVTPTPPLEAEFAMVCLIPSLPSHLFAHPFPRHVCQVLWLLSSPCSPQDHWLPRPILCLPPCFLNPFPRHVHQYSWLLSSPWLTSRSLGCLVHLCPPPCRKLSMMAAWGPRTFPGFMASQPPKKHRNYL